MTVLASKNPIQPIIWLFEHILQFFHDLGLGWGLSIVFLTVLVRACLLPLTLRQFKSMRSLAAHGPELKRIQEKYKDDKQRQQQEVMKFYRENKINPLASCLPLVAQLPVFLGLFYMLRKDLKEDICGKYLHGVKDVTNTSCSQAIAAFEKANPHVPVEHTEKFLFVHDLTMKATGLVLVVLIILYVGSQLVSGVLMAVNQDRNQRMLMLALPFVFVLFILRFPAGLIVYWITTNIWTIAQQAIVRKRLGPITPPTLSGAFGGGSKKSEDTAGSSGEAGKVDKSAGPTASARSAPPPPSPRKKKKRSGRKR